MMTSLLPLASSINTSGSTRNVPSRKKRNPAISRPTDSPVIDPIPIPKPNRSSMKPMIIVRKVSFSHIPQSLNSAISLCPFKTCLKLSYAGELSLIVRRSTNFVYIYWQPCAAKWVGRDIQPPVRSKTRRLRFDQEICNHGSCRVIRQTQQRRISLSRFAGQRPTSNKLRELLELFLLKEKQQILNNVQNKLYAISKDFNFRF